MTTGGMRASGERVPMEGWQPIKSLLVRLSFNLLVLVAEHRFHARSEDRAAAHVDHDPALGEGLRLNWGWVVVGVSV